MLPFVVFDGTGGRNSKMYFTNAREQKEKLKTMLFYSKIFYERQAKLRASKYTWLLELLGDSGIARYKVTACTGGVKDESPKGIGKLVILPPKYIGVDR